MESALVRWPLRNRCRYAGFIGQRGFAELLHIGMPLFAAPDRRLSRPPFHRSSRSARLRLRQLLEPAPHAVRLVQSFLRRICGLVHPFVLHGDLDRLEDSLVAEYVTHEHDVLVIGAGGAGLRAAAEAAAAGVTVAVISKSLLGKAHTVMAEAASRPLSPTWTIAIPGAFILPTLCAAAST